jgi:hypothetical protein
MFESAGNLCLLQESTLTASVAFVDWLEAFEGDLALEFLVVSQVNFSQPTPGMKLQEPVACRRGNLGITGG